MHIILCSVISDFLKLKFLNFFSEFASLKNSSGKDQIRDSFGDDDVLFSVIPPAVYQVNAEYSKTHCGFFFEFVSWVNKSNWASPPIYLYWDFRNYWHSPVWNIQFDFFLSLQVMFVEEAGSATGCVYKRFYHDNSTHQGR